MGLNDNEEQFPYEGTFTVQIGPGIQLPRIPEAVEFKGELMTATGRIARTPSGFLFIVESSLRGPGGEFPLDEDVVRVIWGESTPLFQKKEA